MAAIDSQARRLGLSRSEYLRRQLAGGFVQPREALTTEDLSWFAETFADLDDPAVMSGAWR